MNENLLNIVKQIIAANGEGILSDPARLKSLFSDLAKDEPKPLRVAFGRCIQNGAYIALKTAPDTVDRISRKTAIAQRLRDEHGLDIGLCAEALDILEAALYGSAQTAYTPPPHQQPRPYQNQPVYQPSNYTAPPSAPVSQPASFQTSPGNPSPAPAAKNNTIRNVLIAAVVLAAIGAYYFSTRPQSTQVEQSGAVSDAELRSGAAEIAETVGSAVFEGFDPAESIQHYYFIPISVDEFQSYKEAKNDGIDLSIVTSYATDDGVIKARRAGYNANYGMIIYSVNSKAVLGLADVTLKEEDIYIGYGYGTSKYALSNRLGDIENAIYTRTGKTIGLSNVQWTLNTVLSENVKARMNKHNVNYSMTVSTYAGRHFIVNKRENGRWYYFILDF